MERGWWRAAPAYALGAVLGVLLGIVGAFLAPARPLPFLSVGVLIAVVGNVLVPYHLGRAAESPIGAIVPALAWLVTTVYLGTERREGDLIVTGAAWGLAFLVLGAVAAALTIPRVRPAIQRDRLRELARQQELDSAEPNTTGHGSDPSE